MPYIGKILSVNYCYTRQGFLKSQARKWRDALALSVRVAGGRELKPPIRIYLTGYFRPKHRPDIHNLHKLIADGIQAGIEIDDVNFLFYDVATYVIREGDSYLRICLREATDADIPYEIRNLATL